MPPPVPQGRPNFRLTAVGARLGVGAPVALLVAALAAALVAAPGGAAMAGVDYLEDASVSYSARVEVRTGPNAYRGRIYHRPGMQRRAFAGHGRYLILRFDRGVAWSVDPARRHWWPESLSAAGLLSRAQISLVQIGEARLLGRRARIYQLSGMVSSGDRIRGRVWIDRAGILLRAQITAQAGTRRRTYHMRLLSLKIGTQDGALFTRPAAYRRRTSAPRWTMVKAPDQDPARDPTKDPAKRTKPKASRRESLEDLFRR